MATQELLLQWGVDDGDDDDDDDNNNKVSGMPPLGLEPMHMPALSAMTPHVSVTPSTSASPLSSCASASSQQTSDDSQGGVFVSPLTLDERRARNAELCSQTSYDSPGDFFRHIYALRAPAYENRFAGVQRAQAATFPHFDLVWLFEELPRNEHLLQLVDQCFDNAIDKDEFHRFWRPLVIDINAADSQQQSDIANNSYDDDDNQTITIPAIEPPPTVSDWPTLDQRWPSSPPPVRTISSATAAHPLAPSVSRPPPTWIATASPSSGHKRSRTAGDESAVTDPLVLAQIEQLCNMGFERADVLHYLKLLPDNFETAVERLLMRRSKPKQPEQPPAEARAPKRRRARTQVISDESFVVEKIVGKKKDNGKVYYRIKWQGYPDEENTWEPIEHLLPGALTLLQDFEAKYSPSDGVPKSLKKSSSSSSSSTSSSTSTIYSISPLKSSPTVSYSSTPTLSSTATPSTSNAEAKPAAAVVHPVIQPTHGNVSQLFAQYLAGKPHIPVSTYYAVQAQAVPTEVLGMQRFMSSSGSAVIYFLVGCLTPLQQPAAFYISEMEIWYYALHLLRPYFYSHINWGDANPN